MTMEEAAEELARMTPEEYAQVERDVETYARLTREYDRLRHRQAQRALLNGVCDVPMMLGSLGIVGLPVVMQREGLTAQAGVIVHRGSVRG